VYTKQKYDQTMAI